MNYIEKYPLPQCCEDCPEASVEVCFHCPHFREKFEVLDSELAEELLRRKLLRKLLKVARDDDYSILRWRPATKRPVENTYVLLKEWDEEFGVISSFGCYEGRKFWYFSSVKPDRPVDESRILGWDYLPYDDHPNEEEEKLMEVYLRKMGRLMWEEFRSQWEQWEQEEEAERPQD